VRLADRLRDRLLRPGRPARTQPLFHVSPARLRQTEGWFDRYGDATVFFSRMLPLVRTFVSVPAGVARMRLGRFALLTTLGSIPWVLALIGKGVGQNWESWRHHLAYLDYVIVAAALLGVGWWLLRRRSSDARPA
jgi:membrane protein DedA with SNARE-associated domain